jgi:tRNA U34 2-thiouridine synthase MnmA/TrmU
VDGARGLGLVSGGLDSLLALLVLKGQSIQVEAVTFTTPFFGSRGAEKVAEAAGVKLTVMDITEDYFEMLKSPAHGYGRLMNPCIDCHALMLKKGWEMAQKKGFDFVFTGEVLGQRPMSQRYDALKLVEKAAGLEGRVLRPLSAKLLKKSEPEELGLVDRERLFDIQGRHRKRQLALAQEFGLSYVPASAGGCLLTDQEFSARLKDLMEHGPALTQNRALILRLGRHFRLPSGARVVVGRRHEENERLVELGDGETVLRPEGFPGPTALLSPGHSEMDIIMAAALITAYSREVGGPTARVEFIGPTGSGRVLVPGAQRESFRPLLVRYGKEPESEAVIIVSCPACGKDADLASPLCPLCGEKPAQVAQDAASRDG